MKGLIVWGTTSDAGKSYIVTGLCRALANRGLKVAPFKGQNMSNNSYVTLSGHEIGRSQGLQAEAAKVAPTVHMNPVLLKPRSDRSAEVIVQGKSLGSPAAAEYRKSFFEKAKQAVEDSLNTLSKDYDVILMEGAGSPAEVNLMDKDLANLATAEMANVPALLTGDIERGGIFASITGTLNLLPNIHKQRVKGLIVNRFRGDPALFQNGISWLERNTDIPVQGVLPTLDIRMEQEDSLSFAVLNKINSSRKLNIDIAVIAMPYVSNYTDLEPFAAEQDVSVRIVKEAGEFGSPDAVIIPGTRSTIHDYEHLHSKGILEKILEHKDDTFLVGICGGFQMMGELLIDKYGADTGHEGKTAKGLEVFPMRTTFMETKKTTQWKGTFQENGKNIALTGFEIHTGIEEVDYGEEWQPLFNDENNNPEGLISSDKKCFGTYVHHVFHNDNWRNWWLNLLRRRKGLKNMPVVHYSANKDKRLDALGEAVESHLDVSSIIRIMEKGLS
ncbi:cobyric acid synthase [Alteribacillus bidgolensis]|uniref:Cobyric acid synthase n=1 Tax=Alteribacillus bidgolensis TaxID=930129 RepID=A0A1G8C0I6_9BACI|nr:cobyric acid synthase [Alteribacillus bidgolensis]SDH38839.1 adenosylcobyric acid synthase (glutamine-hydrolysing) [Alteribacillus bidgolensis]